MMMTLVNAIFLLGGVVLELSVPGWLYVVSVEALFASL
jgi:hypothetical protein